jgi:hypothetical protein
VLVALGDMCIRAFKNALHLRAEHDHRNVLFIREQALDSSK